MTTLTDLYRTVNLSISAYDDHVSMCSMCANRGQDRCKEARELYRVVNAAEQAISDHFDSVEQKLTKLERSYVDQECQAAAEES